MDNTKKMLRKILENSTGDISQDSLFNKSLWETFLEMHPADISAFLSEINKSTAQRLFKMLPLKNYLIL